MPKALSYLLRLIWFVVKNALIVVIVVVLVNLAFFYSSNISNIYVLLADAMQKRAAVVMHMEQVEPSELNNYFYKDCILKDDLLNDKRYEDFNVIEIMHDIEMEWVWLAPNRDVATVKMLDRVWMIDARYEPADKSEADEQSGDKANKAPKWENAEYELVLRRSNGIWRIYSMKKVKDIVLPEIIPAKTLAPSLTPEPTEKATPTPEPTPTAKSKNKR